MKNNKPCCSYRIRLEELKLRIWCLIVLARLLLILAIFLSRY